MNTFWKWTLGLGSVGALAALAYATSKKSSASGAESAAPGAVGLGQDGSGSVGNWSPTAEKYSVGEKKRVMLLGDSLALGLGKYGFPAIVSASGNPFRYDAVGGTTTEYWGLPTDKNAYNDRVDQTLFNKSEQTPNVLIVSLGTNNAGPAFNKDTLEQAVSVIMDTTDEGIGRKIDYSLVWLLPPSLPYERLPNQDKVRALIRDVYAKHRERLPSTPIFLVDTALMKFERSSDGIHATPTGYAQWASQVWKLLQDSKIV